MSKHAELIERLRESSEMGLDPDDAYAAADALEAQALEIEGLRKDAERYRWLRTQDSEDFEFAVVKNPHFDVFESPKELDAAIDAARGAPHG